MGGSSTTPPPPTPTQPPTDSRREPVAPQQKTTKRKAKQAKFITTDGAKTRIQLGADGLLPELSLAEGRKSEVKEKKSQSSNTLVLAGVLLVSFAMSIAMLFIDVSPKAADTQTKSQARARIRVVYTGQESPLAPHEQLLREALLAHSQGDWKRERERYWRVLDMLRAVNRDEVTGLTGARNSAGDYDAEPNDEDLEKQLSILLGQ